MQLCVRNCEERHDGRSALAWSGHKSGHNVPASRAKKLCTQLLRYPYPSRRLNLRKRRCSQHQPPSRPEFGKVLTATYKHGLPPLLSPRTTCDKTLTWGADELPMVFLVSLTSACARKTEHMAKLAKLVCPSLHKAARLALKRLVDGL